MSADDIQIGGNHYKGRKVEHWTYAAQLPYLEGLATKYIDRHRRKGGKQDLLKAIHTIEKMIEEYYPEGEPSPAEVRMGMGMTPCSAPSSAAPATNGVAYPAPVERPQQAPAGVVGLCPNASSGQHQYSHVYKHDKAGRLAEIRKCDLCGDEEPKS